MWNDYIINMAASGMMKIQEMHIKHGTNDLTMKCGYHAYCKNNIIKARNITVSFSAAMQQLLFYLLQFVSFYLKLIFEIPEKYHAYFHVTYHMICMDLAIFLSALGEGKLSQTMQAESVVVVKWDVRDHWYWDHCHKLKMLLSSHCHTHNWLFYLSSFQDVYHLHCKPSRSNYHTQILSDMQYHCTTHHEDYNGTSIIIIIPDIVLIPNHTTGQGRILGPKQQMN